MLGRASIIGWSNFSMLLTIIRWCWSWWRSAHHDIFILHIWVQLVLSYFLCPFLLLVSHAVCSWGCVREASFHLWLVYGALDDHDLASPAFFGSRSNSEFSQINTSAVPYNCSIKNLENIWGYTSGCILYPSALGNLKLSLTAVKQGVNFFFSDPGFGTVIKIEIL
jgi:hypothetical protein